MLPYIAAPWIRHGIWRIWKPMESLWICWWQLLPWNSGQMAIFNSYVKLPEGKSKHVPNPRFRTWTVRCFALCPVGAPDSHYAGLRRGCAEPKLWVTSRVARKVMWATHWSNSWDDGKMLENCWGLHMFFHIHGISWHSMRAFIQWCW